MCSLTLADILTSDVDCMHPDANLGSVFQTLTKNNFSCCVIAGENKIPLGILTERDLVRIVSENKHSSELMKQSVSEHMTTPPSTLPSDTTLEDALNWIESRNLRHLLVTAIDGSMLGIVTQTDMVKAYTRIMRHHSEDLEQTIIQRTEQLETLNRKLILLSLVDPLTGLGNRRAMKVDITKIHAAGIREQRAYSVALFDMDFFKQYNDHYGHQAGDKMLRLVANHLGKGTRESDSVFRYGGEEFLMIMPDSAINDAMITVQRIVERLSEKNIPHLDAPLAHLTISAGIACSYDQGQRLANWRQVVELADEGLYDAKNSGRNQVSLGQPSPLKVVN